MLHVLEAQAWCTLATKRLEVLACCPWLQVLSCIWQLVLHSNWVLLKPLHSNHCFFFLCSILYCAVSMYVLTIENSASSKFWRGMCTSSLPSWYVAFGYSVPSTSVLTQPQHPSRMHICIAFALLLHQYCTHLQQLSRALDLFFELEFQKVLISTINSCLRCQDTRPNL